MWWIWLPPPLHCSFLKNVSSIKRVKPCFFVTFDIILKHIFPENFIEFPLVVQKIWRSSLSILAIFINFSQFFGFFDIALLQRNYWRHPITDDVSIFSVSTLSRLSNNCIKLYWYQMSSSWNMKGGSNWSSPTFFPGKTTFKKPNLVRVKGYLPQILLTLFLNTLSYDINAIYIFSQSLLMYVANYLSNSNESLSHVLEPILIKRGSMTGVMFLSDCAIVWNLEIFINTWSFLKTF